MRNAVFPSFPSPFSSSGKEEAQMPNSNTCIDLQRMNNYSGFFIDSHVSNDLHLGNFTPLSTKEISHNLDHVPGEDFMTEFASENASLVSREEVMGMDILMKEETTMKASKKRKTLYTDCHQQPSEESSWATQQKRAPVRRSLKIVDRVTALQKLVSPYGKTNTASVLQEAAIHIKLLQEQIKVLSTPYFRFGPSLHQQEARKEKMDLHSRGLCLVPISTTVNLTKEVSSPKVSTSGRTFTSQF
ncbi:transcription factor bHLH119-like isoform X2 [Tasmannia lanceolata]|uniref:transcription factor bHLH119-like isoform X2 n=1 Tax=Tasmannia lanceolata TaxID=3420 RepID=UPI0040633B88